VRPANAAGLPNEGVRVCALDTGSLTSDTTGVFRIGRTNTRQVGEQQRRLPILGLDWRF
jgi:hypothetical protein